MPVAEFAGARLLQLRSVVKWIVVIVPMAIAAGSLCAFFLTPHRRRRAQGAEQRTRLE